MTGAVSTGPTLTSGRIKTPWYPTDTSPAARYLPAQASGNIFSVNPWLLSARQRMNELASLPPGWDGAASKAINPAYLTTVWGVISSDFVLSLQAKPDLVPTFGGGLLIEWHTLAVDVIIEVSSAGTSIYACDNETKREVEGTLGEHVGEIAAILEKLALGQ